MLSTASVDKMNDVSFAEATAEAGIAEVFSMDNYAAAEAANIVKTGSARFTVITDRLIRMEYADQGKFEDRKTQRVVKRDLGPVHYRTEDRNGSLTIITQYLRLTYDGNGRFSPQNLRITGNVGAAFSLSWTFGGKDRGNLKGTARTLDEADGAIPLEEGLFSLSGCSVLDDSASMAMTEDGFVTPPDGNHTDLYFFGYGFDVKACLTDFHLLTGKVPLLPRFALGNWWSRYHRYNETEYKHLITRFEKEDIPFAVAVIDMDWHLVDIDPRYGSGWTGFSWNRALFPNPPEFLSWLHEHGLKTTLNLHPADGIRAYEDCYPSVAKDMGVKEGEPVPFDAADKHFLDTYFADVLHPLEAEGVDFWWIDWQQGTSTRIAGLDPLWMLNHFQYLDSTRNGKRGLIFSRYAGWGSHRYPIGFSGDTIISWRSLAFQPYFTAAASNIGYGWWSHDIGGHMMGTKDDELIARWTQLGTFSPILRLHSSNNEFSGKEPWNYDRDTEYTMKRFLRLRHRLIPYLYTMNVRAHEEDLPIVEPVYWYRQSMPLFHSEELKREYFFGTELLVAPIVTPADPVSGLGCARGYLPEGGYFDIFTGLYYSDAGMHAFYRSLENYPVFARAGAVLPLQKGFSTDNPEALEVHVFPGRSGQFTLKEDDDGLNGAESSVRTKLALVWNGEMPEEDESCAFSEAEEHPAGNQKSGDCTAFIIYAAEGNTACIPAMRSWEIVFRSVENTNVQISGGSGTESRVQYDEEHHDLHVTVTASVTETVTIRFEEGVRRRANDLEKASEKILRRAKMSYDCKGLVMNRIRESGRGAINDVLALIEEESVKMALAEVLTADESTAFEC